MSLLKTQNFKEKLHLLDAFVREYFLIRLNLRLALASFIFSFLMIIFAETNFYVSGTLREVAKTEKTSQTKVSGLAMEILDGGGSSKTDAETEFLANLYSYALAQRMWDKGWSTKIFAGGNTETNPDTMPRYHPISERLNAFLLGYTLNDYISVYDLQMYIKNTISNYSLLGSQDVEISILTQDPELALIFLQDIVDETDQYAKEFLIEKAKSTIDETFKQIAVSRNQSITNSLSATITSEYYSIAMLQSDLPFYLYFADPPHSSEYPVTPNIRSIFLSNLLIFLFISMLIRFVRNNKEDLW